MCMLFHCCSSLPLSRCSRAILLFGCVTKSNATSFHLSYSIQVTAMQWGVFWHLEHNDLTFDSMAICRPEAYVRCDWFSIQSKDYGLLWEIFIHTRAFSLFFIKKDSFFHIECSILMIFCLDAEIFSYCALEWIVNIIQICCKILKKISREIFTNSNMLNWWSFCNCFDSFGRMKLALADY